MIWLPALITLGILGLVNILGADAIYSPLGRRAYFRVRLLLLVLLVVLVLIKHVLLLRVLVPFVPLVPLVPLAQSSLLIIGVSLGDTAMIFSALKSWIGNMVLWTAGWRLRYRRKTIF